MVRLIIELALMNTVGRQLKMLFVTDGKWDKLWVLSLVGFTNQLREKDKTMEPFDYKYAWSPAWRLGSGLQRTLCSRVLWLAPHCEWTIVRMWIDLSFTLTHTSERQFFFKMEKHCFFNMPGGPLTMHQALFSIVPQWCCLSVFGLWAITKPGQPPQGKGCLLENQCHER